MTNEIDNKSVISEGDRPAAATESTFNSIDLFKQQVIGKSDIKSNSNDVDTQKCFGNLEIVTGKPTMCTEDQTYSKSLQKVQDISKLQKGLDNFSSIKEVNMKFQPLTRTETMILDNIRNALRNGSVDKKEDELKTLLENPTSVDRVLQALKNELDPFIQMNWEQGKDNNGNEFIRLNLRHEEYIHEKIPLSTVTELTVGSDGHNSATQIGVLGDRQPVAPELALSEFFDRKRCENVETIKQPLQPMCIKRGYMQLPSGEIVRDPDEPMDEPNRK